MIKKAEKKNSHLRIAITGPSKSGKTYTALRLATLLGGKICVIGTQGDQDEIYAEEFEYDIYPLLKHSPAEFSKAIAEIELAGYDWCIIDSFSHEWEGKDGCLELHEKFTQASNSKDSYAAWNKVTPLHNSLIQNILKSKLHMVATMRSKVKYERSVDDKNRVKIVKLGEAPVQKDRVEYEFDIEIMMEMGNSASFNCRGSLGEKLNDVTMEKPGEELARIIGESLSEMPKVERVTLPQNVTVHAPATASVTTMPEEDINDIIAKPRPIVPSAIKKDTIAKVKEEAIKEYHEEKNAPAPAVGEPTITKQQASYLITVARKVGYSDELIQAVIKGEFKAEKSVQIPLSKYELAKSIFGSDDGFLDMMDRYAEVLEVPDGL